VLTKLDGDARGGAALSVREVTGEPILFASNGEKLADFDVFHPDRMASRILGMGDLLTLIEQAEQAFDADQAAATAAKMGSGDLTLEDFLDQMLAIRKMGPIGNILGMLPGANSGQMKEALAQVDDKQLDRLQAIIRGMTPAERADPKIINGSRRLRIANGSGVSVGDVNDMVNRSQDDEADGRAVRVRQPERYAQTGEVAQGQEAAEGARRPSGARPRGYAGPHRPPAVAAAAAAGARPTARRVRSVEAEVPAEGEVGH
jgi:signal recognition particle GTPase